MNASVEKRIGKISGVRIGAGGYQSVCFGVTFDLSSKKDGWGCGDFWGAWGPDIAADDGTKWTEADRQKQIADAFWRLALLMKDANVDSSEKLVGVPVEVEFSGNKLRQWRVLTEVI